MYFIFNNGTIRKLQMVIEINEKSLLADPYVSELL